MKGWQMSLVLIAVVGMLLLFHRLFHATNQGAPPAPPNATASSTAATTPQPAPTSSTSRDIKGNTTTFTGFDPTSGRITWTLNCSSVLLQQAGKMAVARNVACTFYNVQRQPVATVSARGCRANLNNNDLFFEGRVTATDPLGETLTVQHLRYDGAKKRFYGRGGVRMTRANSVLLGDRMWADPNLKQVQLEGNVRGFVHTLVVASPSPVAPPTIPPPPSDAPAPVTVPVRPLGRPLIPGESH